jgi:hypothetical protein
MAASEWHTVISELGPIFASDLDWLVRTDRNWVLDVTLASLRNALTKYHPAEYIIEESLFEPVMGPFIQRLAAQPDERVLRFCWDLMLHDQRGYTGAFAPIRWLSQSGRLSGDISVDNLECAISLNDDAQAMFWWPEGRWPLVDWARDCQSYMAAMEHPSYLVRGAASAALGALFKGCNKNQRLAPSVGELMEFIQGREQKRPGVAGPFLNGCYFSNGGSNEGSWMRSSGFDFRSWFLETLRTCGREPDIPHLITLEFHAHEFLCCDGPAIEELLDMGREYAAILTATQSRECIDRILPALLRMSQSGNPRVAGAIQIYLRERVHHAGMKFFEDFEP